MGMIIYGTKVFTKQMGFFGEKKVCSNCGREYKELYVKYTTWAHLNEVPLFPVKSRFYRMCPICGNTTAELNGKEAKAEMINGADLAEQNIEIYAKHILANKPKGILSVDQSYELWVKDVVSGEEICVASEIMKDDAKRAKKERGYKKLPIIDV